MTGALLAEDNKHVRSYLKRLWSLDFLNKLILIDIKGVLTGSSTPNFQR